MAKKNVPYDQKYYDDVETWPREKLEELQLERLKDELVWAYEHSPYYKRTWDAAGIDPHITSLKDLEKFPFINKQTERDCQGVGSFFGELCCVPEDDVDALAVAFGLLVDERELLEVLQGRDVRVDAGRIQIGRAHV